MKKNGSPAIPKKTELKGAFYKAGEVIGSIGFHIVDGKDKVIGVFKKKLGNKQKPESKATKITKKKLAGTGSKKITKGVRKTAKKTSPEKVAGKKAARVKKPAKSADVKE